VDIADLDATALTSATRRLAGRFSRWTQPRWAVSSRSGRSRADIAHELLQEIADLAADAEGLARRPVPTLAPDSAMGDQLRVLAADLIAAKPSGEILARATALVEAAQRDVSAS